MQRSKKSIYNAISAALLMIVNGVFGLVLTKLILESFGSDFNGLNSTASQFISMLLLLEAGFTIATNVALFKPYKEKKYGEVNGIISATRKTFQKIGVIFLFLGSAIAFVYALFINTGLSYGFTVLVLLMAILPASFNLYYATKYRILIQAEQKEYVISIASIATLLLGYLINIIGIKLGFGMWTIRFVTMCCSFLNSLIIGLYVKRHFTFIDFKVDPNFGAITGTKDVFVQKLTAVFYSTAPILSITLSPGGTVFASIYAVYNNVFSLLKNMLHAVIDAPRLGIGELAAVAEEKRVWKVFKEYQLAVFYLMFVVFTVATLLILPFIKLYTSGLADAASYVQPTIAILLVLISCFELLHIPSGHLINMSGNFKVSRNIQLLSCGVLLLGIAIGVIIGSLTAILSAVLITAILLAILEIGFIHLSYFKNRLGGFFRLFLPLAIVGVMFVWLAQKFMPTINSLYSFALWGVILVVAAAIIGLIVCYLSNKEETKSLAGRVKGIIKRKR